MVVMNIALHELEEDITRLGKEHKGYDELSVLLHGAEVPTRARLRSLSFDELQEAVTMVKEEIARAEGVWYKVKDEAVQIPPAIDILKAMRDIILDEIKSRKGETAWEKFNQQWVPIWRCNTNIAVGLD